MREAEDIGAWACQRARVVGEKFRKPDDDWQPVLLVWRHGQEVALSHLRVPSATERGLRRALFEGVVPEMIRTVGGTAAALITSAWLVEAGSLDQAKDTVAYVQAGGTLQDRDDRKEVVYVTAGDADGALRWVAEIKRDGQNPPTLGEWVLDESVALGRVGVGLSIAFGFPAPKTHVFD